MMLSVLVVVCWLVLIYAWLGYPLILRIVAGRVRTSRKPASLAHAAPPAAPTSVAVLFSAHNEQQHIDGRIGNLVELDYPVDRAAILVGVDGADDATAQLARNWSDKDPRVRVIEVAERRGKAAMLKDLVRTSGADILILTDANTVFRRDAVSRLIEPFNDSRIGGVCGRLVFTRQCNPQPLSAAILPCSETPVLRNSLPPPESAYWRWETELKQRESCVDSCLGANGAIYALRRDLFWGELPDNTIIDDFVLGMKVREQGFRMIYEPAAIADEEFPAVTAHEWGRRTRIGAGGFQALVFCRRCLLPRYGAFAWMLWSHKVLRWFTAHLMLAALLPAVLHLGQGFKDGGISGVLEWSYAPAVLTLLTWLGIVGAVGLNRLAALPPLPGKWLPRFLELTDHFMTMQTALLVGFFRFCRGNLKGYWERTPRA
jgi:cellulose synthase/poly-beta-1,6-N-acetylglucosamine synthase-like glycosyltransferase